MKENKLFIYFSNPIVISLFIITMLFFISPLKFMGDDEGMWSYIGRIWSENKIPPYAGAIENKTPGIFELNAVSYALFGVNIFFVRVLGIISIILSSLIVFLTGRELHSRLAGIFSMYIFGLTMTWKLLDGAYVAQTETFMVMFSVLSFYFAIKGKDNPKWKYWILLAGISIGVAISFKQIALTTLLALVYFVIACSANNLTKQQKLFGIIMLGLGICFSLFVSLIPLLLSGVSLKEYFDGAWMILLNPVSSGSLKTHIDGFIRVWLDSRMMVFYPFLFLILFQRDLVRNWYFIGLMVWLLFDFIGVNSSGYYFGHQLKQLIPALSIIIGILLSNLLVLLNSLKEQNTKYASIILVTIILIMLPYDLLFFRGHQIAAGQSNNTYREIGTWLRDNTDQKDYVYVIGRNGNPILSYSERVSSSKYFNSIFITSDAEERIVLSDLKEKPPAFIIKPQNDKSIGSKIEEFMVSNYTFLQSKYNYDIFRRN
jgi:hypothetical protein